MKHNPRCRMLQDPPTLQDPNDCNCGAIPPLPADGSPTITSQPNELVSALRTGRATQDGENIVYFEGWPIKVVYENHRGEIALRQIKPLRLWFGVTEFYPQPQWLLDVFDYERDAERTYALAKVRVWGLPA